MEKTKLYRYTRYWGDGNICERSYHLDRDDAQRLTNCFKGTRVEPFIEIKELEVDMNDYAYCEGCDMYYERVSIHEFNGYDYCKDCINDELN